MNNFNIKIYMFARLSLLAMVFILSACAPTTHIVRKPVDIPVAVEGINILFVNSPMVNKEKPVTQVTNKELSSPFMANEKLRDTAVANLPKLFEEKGVVALAASTNPVPGVSSPSLRDLFPEKSLANHLLVILPISATTICQYGFCNTLFSVSLSLRTPVENKEIALMYLVQEPFNRVKTYDEFVAAMASNILPMISTKIGSGNSFFLKKQKDVK